MAHRIRELLRDVEKTTQMRPNQLLAILIFLITPTTTWLFAGYPYTTEIQKATKISNENSSFNSVHSGRRKQGCFVSAVSLIGLEEIRATFCFKCFHFFNFWLGPCMGRQKLQSRLYFKSFLRGIGKSFQSAITAPRVNLTDYGNATAQS